MQTLATTYRPGQYLAALVVPRFARVFIFFWKPGDPIARPYGKVPTVHDLLYFAKGLS